MKKSKSDQKLPSFRRLDIIDKLQIPRDIVHQESIITISGNGQIYIENYRNILEYTNTCIRILCKRGRLKIKGTQLSIEYYSDDEMKITGRFQGIFFD